ncbi:hypothetical protein MMPV_000655 [Pyropia vietnamensis]
MVSATAAVAAIAAAVAAAATLSRSPAFLFGRAPPPPSESDAIGGGGVAVGGRRRRGGSSHSRRRHRPGGGAAAVRARARGVLGLAAILASSRVLLASLTEGHPTPLGGLWGLSGGVAAAARADAARLTAARAAAVAATDAADREEGGGRGDGDGDGEGHGGVGRDTAAADRLHRLASAAYYARYATAAYGWLLLRILGGAGLEGGGGGNDIGGGGGNAGWAPRVMSALEVVAAKTGAVGSSVLYAYLDGDGETTSGVSTTSLGGRTPFQSTCSVRSDRGGVSDGLLAATDGGTTGSSGAFDATAVAVSHHQSPAVEAPPRPPLLDAPSTGCLPPPPTIHGGTRPVVLPRFFVAADTDRRMIVVAIRGTWSIADAVLDLTADDIQFFDGWAHRGMADAALGVFDLVWPVVTAALRKRAIAAAAAADKGATDEPWGVVVTGHSMGGGTASLLVKLFLAAQAAAAATAAGVAGAGTAATIDGVPFPAPGVVSALYFVPPPAATASASSGAAASTLSGGFPSSATTPPSPPPRLLTFPVHGYALAPPPTFGPLDAVDPAWAAAVTAVVHDDDLIPRLSVWSARALLRTLSQRGEAEEAAGRGGKGGGWHWHEPGVRRGGGAGGWGGG